MCLQPLPNSMPKDARVRHCCGASCGRGPSTALAHVKHAGQHCLLHHRRLLLQQPLAVQNCLVHRTAHASQAVQLLRRQARWQGCCCRKQVRPAAAPAAWAGLRATICGCQGLSLGARRVVACGEHWFQATLVGCMMIICSSCKHAQSLLQVGAGARVHPRQACDLTARHSSGWASSASSSASLRRPAAAGAVFCRAAGCCAGTRWLSALPPGTRTCGPGATAHWRCSCCRCCCARCCS